MITEGLIQKVPKAHRYQLTSHGRLAITAILTVDPTSIAALKHVAKLCRKNCLSRPVGEPEARVIVAR